MLSVFVVNEGMKWSLDAAFGVGMAGGNVGVLIGSHLCGRLQLSGDFFVSEGIYPSAPKMFSLRAFMGGEECLSLLLGEAEGLERLTRVSLSGFCEGCGWMPQKQKTRVDRPGFVCGNLSRRPHRRLARRSEDKRAQFTAAKPPTACPCGSADSRSQACRFADLC